MKLEDVERALIDGQIRQVGSGDVRKLMFEMSGEFVAGIKDGEQFLRSLERYHDIQAWFAGYGSSGTGLKRHLVRDVDSDNYLLVGLKNERPGVVKTGKRGRPRKA